MWFLFSVIALLCWSGSDLFSKIGCQDSADKYSHLKMAMAVGVVMGLHALYEILFQGTVITWEVALTYLPVSALYIASMTIGYLGLRYIELSISSPICNASGAIVAVLTLLTVGIGDELPPVALVAVALVCVGVIALGITESREDEDLRRARQDASNHHYAKSWIAIAIPVVYCLLDALGTFADSRVLDVLTDRSAEALAITDPALLEELGESIADSCNVAYELTFLFMGIVCAVYVLLIRKQKLFPRQEAPKYTGAIFETIGQFFYIHALLDTEHVVFSAPIISSYCVVSMIWSRLVLREKLSKKHYACIAVVIAGIIILGILDI